MPFAKNYLAPGHGEKSLVKLPVADDLAHVSNILIVVLLGFFRGVLVQNIDNSAATLV